MPRRDRYRKALWIAVAAWIGATATLTWLSYGDAARLVIASSYPKLLGLLAPPAPIAAPSADQQRLNAMSLDLDAVRQIIDRIATTQEQITHSIDQLTAGQEQMTRNVDQLFAGQEQMTREITKLQGVEKQILQKNSEPSPRSAPALTRNPAPRLLAPMVR